MSLAQIFLGHLDFGTGAAGAINRAWFDERFPIGLAIEKTPRNYSNPLINKLSCHKPTIQFMLCWLKSCAELLAGQYEPTFADSTDGTDGVNGVVP